MAQQPDSDTPDHSEDLPEELEDYEYELRVAALDEDDEPFDDDPDAPWLAAQREARSRRGRRGRKGGSGDWVNDAFEDYLATRSNPSRARRSGRG